ncbi:glycerate kinase [Tumidithrix elongata RA019]|uniref:Glycerate kinase n=1 Tax=Tumidithrix elongata BACA0141 TaxID=2716417 RepID=A0AAW9Q9D8_9CYAN|nr:glycerate kinase [Tumidithrix elongata RA019]
MNAGDPSPKSPTSSLSEILLHLATGDDLTDRQQKQLETDILRDDARARAFDLTQHNVAHEIERRSRLVQPAYDLLRQDVLDFSRGSYFLETLWNLWLPLAMRLADRAQHLGRPFIQGVLGGQGTGKTTLGAILERILRLLGKSCVSISLDDLYKTYADRQQLRERDPRLIWRGPPSTHDVELGVKTLERLRDRTTSIEIPRFDKSLHNGAGDRISPLPHQGADIVWFEGWFVGVHPLPISKFSKYMPPLVSEADREFALECNARLYDYIPLWQQLDSLIVLKPLSYEFSVQWRQEAERQRLAQGKTGMSDAEILEFVQYFWRSLPPELFMTPLTQSSKIWNLPIDLVVAIDANHLPCAIYRPD